MEEKVGYQPELTKAPVEVDDWRVQEMYDMAPDAVMGELLGLSEEILDARATYEEARREARDARERLDAMETQVLQAALDSEDKDVSDQVKGKNAEERKRKASIFLAAHKVIQELRSEVAPLELEEVATRLAMEEAIDRQKNLHTWARMFEAQVKLLATVRVPETSLEELGEAIGKAYREPVLDWEGIGEGVQIPVLTEDEVLDAMGIVGVEIPTSLDVPDDEIEDLKAAVERYQDEPPVATL